MPELLQVTPSELNRIFEKITIPSDKNEVECWSWCGAKETAGYGSFNFRGHTIRATRLIWSIYRGEIPNDLMVLHKCNNRACVNINHLYLGNTSNNSNDAYKDGSMLVGENHGFAKFSDERVEQIKQTIFSGEHSYKEIASMFECDPSYVSRLANNKRRKYDYLNTNQTH